MASKSIHTAVMPREVLKFLQLRSGLNVMDGTVGAGGHSVKIQEQIGSEGRLFGFDRDPMMLQFASENLAHTNAELIRASYTDAEQQLADLGVSQVDRVLLDLGLSSDQLADRERGFGFDAGGPLDMRFHAKRGMTAADLLAKASATALAEIFTDYADEPYAAQIADEICRRRKSHPLTTTAELEDCVRSAVPGAALKSGKTPATRVFQALRIAVNQELDHVRTMMQDVLRRIVAPDGIVVVLTFHSIEDRMVKTAFKEKQTWQVITKNPIEATPAEIRLNPRSRSTKLRAAKRLPT